jgi:hypothetical protein
VDALPDSTAPTVGFTAPADGARYAQHQVVNADYSCQDNAQGSGVATCSGPVASGSPIDTSTVGSHTFNVTTTDNAGNSTSQSVTYTVFGARANTAAPTISGSAAPGQMLTCSPGTWTNDPTGFTYEWLSNGTAIQGAAGPELRGADSGSGRDSYLSRHGSERGRARRISNEQR